MAQISRYPAKVMNITQSYKGSFSHSKNYNGSPRDYPIDEASASEDELAFPRTALRSPSVPLW